jgi:PPM family protein phosphatase
MVMSVGGTDESVAEAVTMEAELKVRPGVELGNLTDVGCRRSHNEDYYCYAEPESEGDFAVKGRLLVIADGMGGHQGGEVASGIAIEVVRGTYLAGDAATPRQGLILALQAAHTRIQDFAREHPEFEGMGTTCLAAAIRGSELTYAHVGDSRLYLVRGSSITQLTEDQTVVNQFLQQGLISPDQVADHPGHGVLTAALGIGDQLAAEVPEHPIALQSDDVLLMCTDGLHDLVEQEEMASIATATPPATACRTLIDLAKSRGGHDNITVQILKLR